MPREKEISEQIINQRSEEVRDIIHRIPHTFARHVTYIVGGIISLLLLFGYIIKYPDVMTGEVTISSQQAPLKLIAEQNGRLRLNKIKSHDIVETEQLLAWIENPAAPYLVDSIRKAIAGFTLPLTNAHLVYSKLPRNINLGDITIPYSTFLSSLKQLSDYQQNSLYDKQETSLSKVLAEQQQALSTLREKEELSRANMQLGRTFMHRDSILLSRKVISQFEFEQSIASSLTSEDQFKSSLRNTGLVREQINNTENLIQQNRIVKSEKELELDLEVVTTYNNLLDRINLWEKQYLIRTPLNGKVQFLKFWSQNQFVQMGEPLFSIVSPNTGMLGQVQLPISGAGKVKVGQDVIVKLADYPYMEYGYVKAKVNNIALVSTPLNTGDNIVDTYLVTLSFPNNLKTNYGTQLDFKFEIKGLAEIITKDRRLIERFFDNLKYIGHSK